MSVLVWLKRIPVLIGVLLCALSGLLGSALWLQRNVDEYAMLEGVVARERMAAQRLQRWLLELQQAADRGRFDQAQRKLRQDVLAIDQTLTALATGGVLELAPGQMHRLPEDVLPPQGRTAIAAAEALWLPQREGFETLLGSAAELYQARQPVAEVRGRLGPSADDLDASLARIGEVLSEVRAGLIERQRLLQGAALLLLVLLSAWVWVLARRQQAELARHRAQLADMLLNLPVGVFLLDRDLRVGELYSQQLEGILQRPIQPQQNVAQLLHGLVSEETMETAREFLALLFSERVNQNLVGSLNPLDQVELKLEGSPPRRRFLCFGFRRVHEEGRVSQLMVSVTDITERVVLQQELDRMRGASDLQGDRVIEIILQLMRSDAEVLQARLTHWRALLKEANLSLKQSTRSTLELRRLVDRVYRPVHLVKGEAAALQLSFVASRARAAEEELSALREREGLEGNDFLPVTVRLEELFAQFDLLERMLQQLQRLRPESRPRSAPAAAPADFLQQLVSGLAGQLGRSARVLRDGEGLQAVDAGRRRAVEDLLGQLARNALAHGLESKDERSARGKSPVGEIRYGLRRLDDGGLELAFKDDGRGIDPALLRRQAVASGRYDQAQAAALQPRQLLALIFQPGFSTAVGSSDAAGRGVGLDIVADTVRRLGGRIGVNSVPGQGTEFRIRLPAVAAEPVEPKGAVPR